MMTSNSTLKVPTTTLIPNKLTNWVSGFILLTTLLFSGVSFGQGTTCGGATSLTIDGPCDAGTISDNTQSGPSVAASGCGGTFRREGWYTFTVTGGPINVTITADADNRNLFLQLLSSTSACGGLAQIACANDIIANNSAQVETITATLANGTYYIKVVNASNGTNGASTGNMTLNSICIATTPPNDDCAGAIELFSDPICNVVTGTTAGATESLAAINCGGFTGDADDDVWYDFVATNTTHSITVTPGTLDDVVVELRTSACAGGATLACADDTVGSDSETINATGLTVGTTYNIRIYSWGGNGDQGTFDICVTEPCPTVSATASAVVICEGESTTLTASSAGSLTYEWYEDFDALTLTGTLIGSGPSVSVSPTEPTVYAVLTNCDSYNFVTVAVVPAPTVMTTTPVEVTICDSDAIIHELSVSGGTIPNVALSETFNPDSSIPWITSFNNDDSDPAIDIYSFWSLGDGTAYPGWSSNDNSQFALIDNDFYGFLHYFVLGNTTDYFMRSNLDSAPFSLADYQDPINLTFYHYFREEFGAVARVQISTDLGASWSDLAVYTTTQGANNNFALATINLDTYAGEPAVMLRFNYESFWDWYWAIDNVTVNGTPLPTTITWSPNTDLYTDAAATIPYTGQNLNTVYTMPTQSITYTATSESFYGCTIDTDVDVIGGVAVWNGAAWLNGSIPDIGKNVVLNGNYVTDAITGSFSACNLIVNANLGINDGYLVEVENDVIVSGNVVVESRGALVQNDDAGTFTLTGAGTSSVNKLTALKQRWYDYTYWSSPVENETVDGAFPDTPANRRFWFNAQNYLDTDGDDISENVNDWTIAPGGSQLLPGVGYAATSVNTGPFPRIDTSVFNGAFNTGDVDVDVYTNPANILNDWNFIGNPYPSAINFTDFHTENSTVIDGAAYLWSQWSPPLDSNPGNQAINFNQNDYAIITAGSGGTAGASGVTPLGYIPSGQGFFVHALNTGTVTFKNNARIPFENNNTQFFRAAQTNANRLWVNLTSDNGVFNQILVAYVDGATDGFDGYSYDAPRNLSTGNAASLVTFVENVTNQQFAIQGKDPNSLTIEEVISLGFSTSITQPTIYKLSIAQFEGEFFTNQTVYVKDNLLNLYHDLSASDYSFLSQTGTFNNRFEIVFQNQTLSDGGIDLEPNDLSIIELNNGQVKFVVGHNLTIESVEIFDMQGRILYNLSGSNGTEIYNLSNLSQAAYIAKVTLSNGQTITKRAVKRK